MRYRVKDGVRVVVAGTPHSNGAEFEAAPDQVVHELRFGLVTEVAATAKARARRKST